MAIKFVDKYTAGRVNGPDSDYPQGSLKNESTRGADNGTPFEQAWQNDLEGLPQGIMKRAGVTANGDVDTADGQYVRALEQMTTPGPTPAQASFEDLCAGLPGIQWESPVSSPNYVNTGETIRDSCLAKDQNTEAPAIYVLHGDTDISPLNGAGAYTTPSLVTALSLTYTATPAKVCTICSDGTYLYVAWYETAGDLQISRFSQGESAWTEDWSFDTNIANSAAFADGVKMCVADSTRIGLLIPFGTSPYQVTCATMSKDGVSFYTGTFSPAQYTFFQSSKIVSDGTYLYYISHTGSDPYAFNVCQHQISSLGTYASVQLASSVSSSAWAQYPTGIALAHGNVITTCPDGTVYCALLGTGAADVGSLDMTHLSAVTNWGTILDSDGTNLWSCHIQVDYAGTGLYRVFKIPPSGLSYYVRTTTLPFHSFFIDGGIAESNKCPGRMLFDGKSLWLINYDGYIYRIVAPTTR